MGTNRCISKTGDVLIVALVKRGERYILTWEQGQEPAALRVIGRWASNPDLSFTWYDAAILANRIRESLT